MTLTSQSAFVIDVGNKSVKPADISGDYHGFLHAAGVFGDWGLSLECLVTGGSLWSVWWLGALSGLFGDWGLSLDCLVTGGSLWSVWWLGALSGVFGDWGFFLECLVTGGSLWSVWWLHGGSLWSVTNNTEKTHTHTCRKKIRKEMCCLRIFDAFLVNQ